MVLSWRLRISPLPVSTRRRVRALQQRSSFFAPPVSRLFLHSPGHHARQFLCVPLVQYSTPYSPSTTDFRRRVSGVERRLPHDYRLMYKTTTLGQNFKDRLLRNKERANTHKKPRYLSQKRKPPAINLGMFIGMFRVCFERRETKRAIQTYTQTHTHAGPAKTDILRVFNHPSGPISAALAGGLLRPGRAVPG